MWWCFLTMPKVFYSRRYVSIQFGQLCCLQNIPVLVDPKQLQLLHDTNGATTIYPNLSELSTLASGVSPNSLDAIMVAGQKMVVDLDLESLIATMSEKGIALLRGGSRFIAPATARQVFDVSVPATP